jgi:hypothetical protein
MDNFQNSDSYKVFKFTREKVKTWNGTTLKINAIHAHLINSLDFFIYLQRNEV